VTTWGIKLGTRPAGAVRDPGNIAVGDLLWFRPCGHRLETPTCGRLFKRRVQGADKVRVDRIPYPGYVLVSHYP
jgi:hypothetical protein